MNMQTMKESDFSESAKTFMLAFDGEPWNEVWTYEQAYTRIDEMMSSKISRGYVAYDDETAVSMCCGRIMTYLDFKELWIDEFCVHPAYQGQGIGGKILTFIREQLQKEDVRYIVLATDRGYPAVKFYEKNGFKIKNSLVFMFDTVEPD